MEHSASQLPASHQLWVWFEKNGKQVAMAIGAAAVIGLIIYYVSWKRQQTQDAASAALSLVELNRAPGADPTDAYLKVAADHPKTSAGQQAALLAAGSYFTQGKFEQAQNAFEKFAREFPASPLAGEAMLGIASSLDALGKADLAATAYKNLIDRHPGENVIPQAKFALGRIYEAQNKLDQAKTLYDDVERNNPYGSVGSEAAMRLEDLKSKHPELFPAPAPVTPVVTPAKPAAVITNAPVPAAASGSNAPAPAAKK
jgi:TolA-binding protein